MGLSGIANFVAVEFDTWDEGSFDPASNNNTNGSHIAINAIGSGTSLAQTGVLPRFNDGGVKHVWVEYDGAIMNVFFSDTDVQPLTPTLSHAVDLGPLFGHSREVFIGFTAGTGGAFQTHEVLSWNFQATYPKGK